MSVQFWPLASSLHGDVINLLDLARFDVGPTSLHLASGRFDVGPTPLPG